MNVLPIVHMTLYKHGVGYYRRRGEVNGEAIKLTFKREEMDDMLKSLTVIDHGGGQIQGIDYDTPQSQQQRLVGCSIILDDTRSLRDLLIALRGRTVKLIVKGDNTESGQLLGLDETSDKPLKSSVVSLLLAETDQVKVFPLNQITGVTLADNTAIADLRFFLQTALGQESHRSITVRLNKGTHDLEVNYIAPAPTWRVSYRLVMDKVEGEADDNKAESKREALLQGWGIFDNRLEEDLTNISLSLTAGMPISFRYDLYTPHTPTRPLVEAEKRTAAGPVMFEEATAFDEGFAMADAAPMPAPKMAKRDRRAFGEVGMRRSNIEDSVSSAATGQALGELFQYNVAVPVTVGRGQSAMVPIVSDTLEVKKDLIYNKTKMPTHPVATLRFNNKTGLTLEHGPVTVLDGGEYVGEAVLAFTVNEAEATVAYSVELGVHIQERYLHETQLNALELKNQYLLRHEFDIQHTTYHLDNRTNQSKTILIEHPLKGGYTVFDTPDPIEKTLNTYRYAIKAAPGKITTFAVKERYLRTRREELHRLSYKNLQTFLKDKFLDKATYTALTKLLDTLAEITEMERKIQEHEKQRQEIYAMQEQVQKNMRVLAKDGEEGQLRSRYVKQLSQSEAEVTEVVETIKQIRAKIASHKAKIEQMIGALPANSG